MQQQTEIFLTNYLEEHWTQTEVADSLFANSLAESWPEFILNKLLTTK